LKKFSEHNCVHCHVPIHETVHEFSTRNFQFELCLKCQTWYKNPDYSTMEAKRLYLALKKRNVPAEIEKNDGFKTIDIAIPQCRFNIEVDGVHHNTDATQAFADLLRVKHSYNKEFYTLRIPNSLVREKLNETADEIVVMLQLRNQTLYEVGQLKRQIENVSNFEQKVALFLYYFQMVFESDWSYTTICLEDELQRQNTCGILSKSLDDSNWINRDAMVELYRQLSAEKRIKDATDEIFADQNHG
jgi:hypothetical protein